MNRSVELTENQDEVVHNSSEKHTSVEANLIGIMTDLDLDTTTVEIQKSTRRHKKHANSA